MTPRILICLAVALVAGVSFSQKSTLTGSVHILPVQRNVYMAASADGNAAFSSGENGVLVVDTMTQPLATEFLAQIKTVAGNRPIVYVVNTGFGAEHTGGNQIIAAAGPSGGVGNAPGAFIFAHWGVLNHMTNPRGSDKPTPADFWPHETFLTPMKEISFNGEAVQILHQPSANSNGDAMVFFRKSDVVVAGDVYSNTTFPVIRLDEGGSLNGSIAALNRIIEITVPKDTQEGGTYVIPGHGRLADEADVVEYRDMVTIIRDRLNDAIKRDLTLEQVKAARLTLEYDARYGKETGPGSTESFVNAAYQSLRTAPAGEKH